MKLLLKIITFDIFAVLYCYSQIYVAPKYQKWPPLRSYPACEEHLSKTPGFFSKTFSRNRVKIQDIMFNFNTTCEDIYSRGFYPQEPNSEEEAEFPIAFVNIVYKDYIFLERIFNIIYAPQNIYCYSIDSKASEIFRERMYNLASCFDNVIIPVEEFNVTSAGYNVSSAHLSCMKALYSHSNKWKYVTLMQNHDVPLRTNAELVKVYKILNNSNDVFTLKSTIGTVDLNADWSFPNIHLFNDDNLNWKLNKSGNPYELKFTKSFVSVSLTREMVRFLTETLNLTKFIEQLEATSPYGMDENFISTINSNDVIKAPGGFTTACLNRGFTVDGITRSAIWIQNPEECYSRKFRHSVCIYGIEDLHRISRLPQLFLNKMMPGYDYGLVMCHLETLYNRTYVPDYKYKVELNDDYYASVPHVRYNTERQQRIAQNLTDYVDLIDFDCEHPYPKDYLY